VFNIILYKMPDDNSLGIEACSSVESSLIKCAVFDVFLSLFRVNIVTQREDSISLTLNLLTTTIVTSPSNASKWQMGFNSAFKGLSTHIQEYFPDVSKLSIGTLHHYGLSVIQGVPG
jgi:hypothetical protein